jgi:ribonuclease BN (tRNA processing enzyme)
MRAGGHILIVDAGTGIIALGKELARRAQEDANPLAATIFFSHMHQDHTQGLPFFAPLHDPASRLHVLAPAFLGDNANCSLNAVMSPPAFPISWSKTAAAKTLHAIHADEVVVFGKSAENLALLPAADPRLNSKTGVQVHAMYSAAHPGGVYFYRIDWRGRSVVYASDTEGSAHVDRQLVEFARNADVLIHDAQYTEDHYLGRLPGMSSTRGWGHSTPEVACALAQAANARELILFHHEPTYDDDALVGIERQARTRFACARTAYEGLEITLALQPQAELQT